MIHHKKIAVFLVLCLGMISLGIAQNNVPPQTQLNKLEQSLKYCEAGIQEVDIRIAEMKANPESVTLAQYQWMKEELELLKDCQKNILNDIKALKKKYPYWPDASEVQNVEDRKNHGSYHAFMAKLDELAARWEDFMNWFGNIKEPSH